MTDFDWQPLLLTFRLATTTTLLLLLVGIPLAGWLAFTRFRFKPVVEAIISLPLVLPPSVLGFYFLLAFNPTGFLGEKLLAWFDLRLLFTFEGLVVASIFYSLPFMVHPVQAGLENLPASLREASYTLGKSRRETFFRVLLPNIKPSLLTGLVLSFAHTIGEFGLVLMIGGNLPGQTRVASVAIYDEVELLHYGAANAYALLLLVISFGILLTVYAINKKWVIF
ncbi:molybdate ABC transporter permease subunit [Larkinella sp. GY13]|uniref:molybdate ABC transporter permease subunit n=1 Tax=Larkinella sp. GY13 TaxID=3453720 RepID=UPI003EEABEAA